MRSGQPQMIERAIRYAQFAARHFASVRAFAKATEMYSAAISAIESQNMLDSRELCGMLIALAETQREAGEVQSSQQSFCRAALLAQDLADMEGLSQIALGMPELGWPFADTPNGVALILAQKSLASLAGGDSTERALLTARVAAELSYLKGQAGNGSGARRLIETRWIWRVSARFRGANPTTVPTGTGRTRLRVNLHSGSKLDG